MTSRLAFVIPTRGRPRELSAAIRSIAEQVTADARILVLYNKGEIDTERAIQRAAMRWPFVFSVGMDGAPDYSDKFRAMMRVASDSEWVWTFGDDDKLEPGALKFMLSRLEQAEDDLKFIHVSERKRASGMGHTFTGRLFDLACSIGWLEMTGFITGNITRGSLLARCADTSLWDVYAKSAYVHSCAILETLKDEQAQFIDLPLVDTQEPEQSAHSLKQWQAEGTAFRYFHVADAIARMMSEGILTGKLPPKFFRYSSYHLWDRHITYFIANAMAGAMWECSWTEHVKLLAHLINDADVAQSIRRDVDDAVTWALDREGALLKAEIKKRQMEELYERRNAAVYPNFFTDGSDVKKVAA